MSSPIHSTNAIGMAPSQASTRGKAVATGYALPGRESLLRWGIASGLTLVLLVFLVTARWFESRIQPPEQTIRTLTGVAAVNIAPPPPPPPSEPPLPPKTPPLPKLDIQINSVAPPIRATADPEMDLTMTMADFAPDRALDRKRMTFSLSELDGQPRLVNRPQVSFPASQRRQGVQEGRVTLEVRIGPSGHAEVMRVLDSSHTDFTSMAKTFAARARFTPPKKDGRAVSAVFHWPLILR